MKRARSIAALAALFATVLVMPAIAKTTNPGPIGRVSSWIGTWTCLSGKSRFTETFTPVMGGKAMRVSITGPFASEGVATFDSGRNAWFYTFVNSDGSYATNTGPVSGSAITFKQVYPPGSAVDTIHYVSTSKYTSAFTTVVNHKKVASSEVCTKS